MEYMVCPLRTRQFEIKDFWTTTNRCTNCGSISPDDFFNLLNEGYSVRWNKETKVFTFTGDKQYYHFNYNHLNHEDRITIQHMYNEKKITLIQ